MPTKVNTSVPLRLAWITYCPSKSVAVVCPVPSSVTVTPGSGEPSVSSTTVPWIFIDCAASANGSKHSNKAVNLSFILLLNFENIFVYGSVWIINIAKLRKLLTATKQFLCFNGKRWGRFNVSTMYYPHQAVREKSSIPFNRDKNLRPHCSALLIGHNESRRASVRNAACCSQCAMCDGGYLTRHSTPSLVSLMSNPASARRSRMRSLVAQSLAALALRRTSSSRSTAFW